jgi:hypothetical protein
MYRRLMKATAFFFLGIKLARLELKKKKTKAEVGENRSSFFSLETRVTIHKMAKAVPPER